MYSGTVFVSYFHGVEGYCKTPHFKKRRFLIKTYVGKKFKHIFFYYLISKTMETNTYQLPTREVESKYLFQLKLIADTLTNKNQLNRIFLFCTKFV